MFTGSAAIAMMCTMGNKQVSLYRTMVTWWMRDKTRIRELESRIIALSAQNDARGARLKTLQATAVAYERVRGELVRFVSELE